MRFSTLLITFYFLFAQTQAYAIDLNKGNVLSASVKNGGSLLVKGKGLGRTLIKGGVAGFIIQQAVNLCLNNIESCSNLLEIDLDELLHNNDNVCSSGSYPMYHAYRDIIWDTYRSDYYHSPLAVCEGETKNKWGGINPKLSGELGSFECSYVDKDGHIRGFSIGFDCKKLSEDELAEKIVNRLTDDQLTIIINNYYNNGNGIDTEELCKQKDVVCKNQEDDTDDYPRWETINGRRCLVNKDKKIIRCEDEPIKDNNDKGNDDKHFCDTTDLTKKVCNFIDWMQETDTRSDDTNVQLQDLAKDKTINKDRVNFSASCPSDIKFTMSFAGATVTPTISYKNFCQAMIKLKPFIIGLSGISGVLIIAGGRRGI